MLELLVVENYFTTGENQFDFGLWTSSNLSFL